MPAALTLFAGQSRWVVPVSMGDKTEVRLHVITATAAGSVNAKIRLLYRTQAAGFSLTITDYATLGTSEVQVTTGSATSTHFASAWTPIVAGALGDVLVAVAGIDGDGAADPGFLSIYMEAR